MLKFNPKTLIKRPSSKPKIATYFVVLLDFEKLVNIVNTAVINSTIKVCINFEITF
jgi:hypothetical protein